MPHLIDVREIESPSTLLDERHHLIHPRLREDEARIRAVMLEERLGVAREFEKDVLLGRPLDGVASSSVGDAPVRATGDAPVRATPS